MKSRPSSYSTVLFAVVFAFAACAAAPAQVTWTTDEESGIKRARSEQRLLIFFLVSDEGRGERQEKNIVDKQREGIRTAFRNAKVSEIVNRACIPVQADSKRNGPLKKALAGKDSANEVVIATPELEVLARMRPGEARNVNALAETLKRCLTTWGDKVYARDIKPDLVNSGSTIEKQTRALAWVRNNNYEKADGDVITLLSHDKLAAKVRVLTYDTLASLATEKAIRNLMSEAGSHAEADKSLRSCTLGELKPLLGYLDGEPDGDFLRAYRILAPKSGVAPKSEEELKSNPEVRAKAVEALKKAVKAKTD